MTTSDRIRELAARGKQVDAIAAELGVARAAVRRALARRPRMGRPSPGHQCPLCGAPASAQTRDWSQQSLDSAAAPIKPA